MAYPYYTGNPLRHAATPADLPIATFSRRPDPKTYMPDAGLIDAVNVALLLGQPLLLTGEPGTGKTQLAFNLAAASRSVKNRSRACARNGELTEIAWFMCARAIRASLSLSGNGML